MQRSIECCWIHEYKIHACIIYVWLIAGTISTTQLVRRRDPCFKHVLGSPSSLHYFVVGQNIMASSVKSALARSLAMYGTETAETYMFWKFPIRKDHVFFLSEKSLAFVNLKPFVPGHTLVTPKRLVEVYAWFIIPLRFSFARWCCSLYPVGSAALQRPKWSWGCRLVGLCSSGFEGSWTPLWRRWNVYCNSGVYLTLSDVYGRARFAQYNHELSMAFTRMV
jgi:hypothetical protein